MLFRLDDKHYLHDRLLEPGTVIGDDTGYPMTLSDGSPMKPSVNMTPLDDEARQCFADTFPGVKMPERDPTKAIPLRGSGDTAKAPPLIQPVSPGQHAPVIAPQPAPAPAPHADVPKPTVPAKPNQDPSLAPTGGATPTAIEANKEKK